MKKHLTGKLLSALLAVAMILGLAAPGFAAPLSTDQTPLEYEQVGNLTTDKLGTQDETQSGDMYELTDLVRVSIVLDDPSTLDAGFSTMGIAENDAAMSYRQSLAMKQATVTASIESLTARELDVVWNLTLAANIISANVTYGLIDVLKSVDGVKDVVLEAAYAPPEVIEDSSNTMMATSGTMMGLETVYSSGYTGAGSLVAVIDTGTDTDHELFNEGAFNYALGQAGVSPKLTVAGIAAVLEQLNAAQRYGNLNASDLYLTTKLPFNFNYIDRNLNVTHDAANDASGGHGSHVAGIAVGNRFVPSGSGSYVSSLDTVLTQGVAPDAQLVTMKVFGVGGGAYDSDYMAAIEDAIILGCDSINLSLGSAYAGFTRSATYEELLNTLTQKDTVVTMAAGNAGAWADYATDTNGNLLLGDVNFATAGSPASFRNPLSVASVNNVGTTGLFMVLSDGTLCTYSERTSSVAEPVVVYTNLPLAATLGRTEPYEFIYVDGVGTDAEFAAIADQLVGKIAICNRGETSFFEKAEAAVKYGAIATIIANNEAGIINMDLSSYTKTNPCVSITQAMGLAIKATGTLHPAVAAEGDNPAIPAYYTGTLTVNAKPTAVATTTIPTMSDFSSWGVSGSLVLKPEITAPGGRIYSVDGETAGGSSYITYSGTSMASPQVAGLAAIMAQYIREKGLSTATGLSVRTLTQSLLMSTAEPLMDGSSYYPVLQQGAGLARLDAAVNAVSYILMKSDATASYADGKVKAELGDDPERAGVYTFSFSLNNLTATEQQYYLSADLFTQAISGDYLSKSTTALGVEASFSTGSTVTLPAGGSVDVTVTLTLTEEAKTLLADYPTGAYIEGFVIVGGQTTHTIPVLGYYGSWTEPTMYEPISLMDALYNSAELGYVPFYNGMPSNSISLRYPGYTGTTTFTGNPYVVENTVPTQRYAISSATTIQRYDATLIRPAASAFTIITDEAGELLYMSANIGQTIAAFYDADRATWRSLTSYDTGTTFRMDQLVSALGVAEGEKITVSVVAVPEYYEVDGALTTQQLQTLLGSGALGDGAFQSTTFTVDDTAPAITAVYKNMLTGALTVETQDNNYVAYVDLLNKNGQSLVGGGVPVQTQANQAASVLFDLDGVQVGSSCFVVVGDYAGNETTYEVKYNDEPVSYVGNVYAFTSGNTYHNGSGSRWVQLAPEEIFYQNSSNYGGVTPVRSMDFYVTAAEYVEDYVYMAGDDGYLYVAPQGDWDEWVQVRSFTNQTSRIHDMAYNYANDTLYAMGDDNTVYSIDLLTGALTQEFTVSIVVPDGSASYSGVYLLAIDDNGTFYTVNDGSSRSSYLFTWTLDDVVDGAITDLETPFENYTGYYNNSSESYGALAWDHDADVLYFINGYNSTSNIFLLIVDPTNGTAAKTNTSVTNARASRLQAPHTALYIVPSPSNVIVPTDTASDVELTQAELTILRGQTTSVRAIVSPWTLTDKSVTWSSSDESVATVSNGVITGVKAGTAVITATSVATPTVSGSCTVTVQDMDTVNLSALIYDKEGNAFWSKFTTNDPSAWTSMAPAEGADYMAGGLNGDRLYVRNNSYIYGVDTDSFEITELAGIYGAGVEFSDGTYIPATDTGAFGLLLAPVEGGYLYVIYPEQSNAMYWDLTDDFEEDPMAAIALEGVGVMDYTDLLSSPTVYYYDIPAASAYVISENGTLYAFTIATYDDGNTYLSGYEAIAQLPISLPGASTGVNGSTASMVYDEATGMLLLAAYDAEQGSRLYAIDPVSLVVAELGSFGDEVQAVALYQYDRSETPSVLLSQSEGEVYEKDAMLLTAKVVSGTTTVPEQTVTWTSSDETVATVDANGVVTGVSAGTVTITATSTANTEIFASATVTVKALASLDAAVTFQVMNGQGVGQWVTVDLTSKALTVDHSGATPLTGAAASNGVYFGTGFNNTFYQVEYSDSFRETAGFTTNPMLDGAGVPAKTYGEGDDAINTFNTALFLGLDQRFYLLQNPGSIATNSLITWNVSSLYSDQAAIAYIGESRDSSTIGNEQAFLVLAGNGNIYRVKVRFNGTGYVLRRDVVGKTDMTFAEHTAVTMDFYRNGDTQGLIVGYANPLNGLTELYFIDLTGVTLTGAAPRTATPPCVKLGNVDGAQFISGLTLVGEHSYVSPDEVAPDPEDPENPEDPGTNPGGDPGVNIDPDPTPMDPEPAHEDICPSRAFTDLNLDVDGWYHAGVDYMLDQALMTGLTATTFGPLEASNRATIVTILYRLAGSPAVTEPSGFVDVPDGRWFSDAIAWAKQTGVVSGVSETEFAPLRTLTREQAVTMLYRYVGQPAVTGDLSAFTDGDSVGSYARDAMTWAVNTGLIVGANGQLLPKDPMNRAALAVFLSRYLQSVED